MMKAFVDDFGDRITAGIVLTKYGHAEQQQLPNIRVFEAGHPLPDQNGFSTALKIIELLDSADERTLVVCLVSGGASALLAAPHEAISLEEKQQVTQQLLKAGADIFELNTVRKHISRVKGGRLAEHAYPARVVSLILSDVIGDPLDVIASGPTAPDSSTFRDAVAVLKKYGLEEKVPKSVLTVLRQGVDGVISETPKQDDRLFSRVENAIVGSNNLATQAAQKKAAELGYETIVLGSDFAGEASALGTLLMEQALTIQLELPRKKIRQLCLIAGGETTVKVTGTGLGGRNTEMALVVAKQLAGKKGITFLSAGTDGSDGPTDAAGAMVDGDTISNARAAGIDPDAFLANNDSYHFFKAINGLIITGPTGTNVMDVQVVLVKDASTTNEDH